MSQTTYSDNPALGRAGQLYDNGPHDILSAVATVDIPVGRFLKDLGLATDGRTRLVGLPSADASATERLIGVSVHSHALESDPSIPTFATIKAGHPINVLRKGRIWVAADEGIDPATDTVFVRHTANGAASQPGMIRNDADTARADELDAGGFLVRHLVLQKTTAAGVVALDINLPS